VWHIVYRPLALRGIATSSAKGKQENAATQADRAWVAVDACRARRFVQTRQRSVG
jgi:hypothetical protein